ncbi:hypothetical protein QTP70_007203 [Hemibagrus guttatus]|uniref:ribonuclease H n=1 Tax=Hemibagrus guttatus TaxID=175788 RepID=A0AAE0V158_9TELE|nr:hypothetical protein QTP70_007203 [Hemibagrus guttatus]
MAPDPYAPSCGWWAYGKVGLRRFFGLCPAESHRQRLGHQALTCMPQPQAWLQGGAPTILNNPGNALNISRITAMVLIIGSAARPQIVNKVDEDREDLVLPEGAVVLQYADDILISAETADICKEATWSLLNRLAQQGFKVSLSKLQFCETEVKYLGFILTQESLSTAKPAMNPREYQELQDIFSKKRVTQLPPHCTWDSAINLLVNAMHQLYVKAEKCEFYKDSITFLGYVISQRGVEMDYSKVKAAMDWPEPTSIKELQWVLRFYCRFIHSYSSIASPQTSLLQGKPRQLQWTQQACVVFLQLKKSFTSAPILRHPEPSLPFIIEVDASSCRIGAMLSQCHGNPGKAYPCAYFSQKLTPTEANYDVEN